MQTHNDPLCRREFLKTTTLAAARRPRRCGPRRRGGLLAPPRISYYMNGEIHVKSLGEPDGKPLTAGYMDFKPSWSKTGDMLVCFRRTKTIPSPSTGRVRSSSSTWMARGNTC